MAGDINSLNLLVFSDSGPSGILGSGGKQNIACADARGVRITALSISSHG